MAESQRARGPIGWADAVAAANALQLQEDSPVMVEMLRLLGLTLRVAEPTEQVEPQEVLDSVPASLPSADERSMQPPDEDVDVIEVVRTYVEELSDELFEIPYGDAEPLAEPPTVSATVRYEPPVAETQLRASVTSLAQRRGRSQRIDVTKSIDLIARCRPLDPVPLLDELTTRAGITVIADSSTPMMPYFGDVDRFLDEVRHVVGSPSVAVSWLDDETIETALPSQFQFEAGRPVLVVSTLGATPMPGVACGHRNYWSEFAWAARAADADVVALVPHRLVAWPQDLAEAMRIVAWDDLANVGRGRG